MSCTDAAVFLLIDIIFWNLLSLYSLSNLDFLWIPIPLRHLLPLFHRSAGNIRIWNRNNIFRTSRTFHIFRIFRNIYTSRIWNKRPRFPDQYRSKQSRRSWGPSLPSKKPHLSTLEYPNVRNATQRYIRK